MDLAVLQRGAAKCAKQATTVRNGTPPIALFSTMPFLLLVPAAGEMAHVLHIFFPSIGKS
jgi:hypothetical protein